MFGASQIDIHKAGLVQKLPPSLNTAAERFRERRLGDDKTKKGKPDRVRTNPNVGY